MNRRNVDNNDFDLHLILMLANVEVDDMIDIRYSFIHSINGLINNL